MNKKWSFLLVLFLFLSINSQSLAEDIHDAAKAGDLEQLKKILTTNPSLVNSTDKDRMTPLHHAVDAGHIKAASLLIQNGAEVNFANYKKEFS